MESYFETEEIAEVACKHFNSSLPKKGKPSSSEWTTFAAIVQFRIKSGAIDKESAPFDYTVVSVGAGTKCMGKNELSPLGDLVSDSHAEILARRAFLLYIYNQMQLTLQRRESILELKTSSSSEKHFALSRNVTFHLFVSHLPCGDAAIIPSPDCTNQEGPSEAKKIKLDKMSNRTGAKLEVGPLVYEDIQTIGKCRIKPGKGDPTICMSCSDQIAKWQILGLQGSLLGNFIPDPIRLSSLVIGSSVPFCQESVDRAIYTRFSSVINDKLEGFDSDFLKEYIKPVVAQASVNFMNLLDFSKNPSPGSIVWDLSLEKGKQIGDNVQVIVNGRKQGATKRNFGKPSAMVEVCRKNLFSRFVYFRKLFSSSEVESLDRLTYSEAKKLNKNYFSRWSRLRAEVMSGWTVKPDHLLQFLND